MKIQSEVSCRKWNLFMLVLETLNFALFVIESFLVCENIYFLNTSVTSRKSVKTYTVENRFLKGTLPY